MEESLFRKEALEGVRPKTFGEIVLVGPASFRVLAGLAAVSAVLVLAFLFLGSYTKRSTVSGQLVPDAGVARIYPPQPAIVLEKRVSEGQRVKPGDVLYVLSADRQALDRGGVQAAISGQVETRRQSLRDELEKTRLLQKEEREAVTRKLEGLRNELQKLDAQIDSQHIRVRLAEDAVMRYQGLLSQDYVSRDQLQQKMEDALDQRNRLQGHERDRIVAGRELAAVQAELAGLSYRHQTQLAPIERNLSSTGQELVESEARRQILVTAPAGGVVTALSAEPGQLADAGRPLLSIVPEGAVMQAHLYASSSAIGFIREGDRVLLRYQAFPYQKFGHAEGTVAAVSKSALPRSDFAAATGGQGDEPAYRIVVSLKEQTVRAYGKAQALQPGMLLEADVLRETRRLYEWALEPLYGMAGKL